MNYEIVFTDDELPEPSIVITKDKMVIFVKKDENSIKDFYALKSLVEAPSNDVGLP